MWVALRSSWYVFSSYRSDVNLWLADGARAFNLWHGVGVKRIQRGRVVGAGAAMFNEPEGSLTARVFADDRQPPDFVLSTSKGMSEVLSHAFGVSPDRCPELGYPRIDHLWAGTSPPATLVDEELHEHLRDRAVVGYFPTVRDDSLSVPGAAPTVERLARILDAQDAVLLFKPHGASYVPVEPDAAVVVLPRDADLSAYLGVCDVLITDYSSVAADYLPLNRAVVLYWADLDIYDGNRGFALDPREFLPGIATRTPDELYAVLSDIRSIAVAPDHERVRDFYWDQRARGGACERIAGYLLAQPPARRACATASSHTEVRPPAPDPGTTTTGASRSQR